MSPSGDGPSVEARPDPLATLPDQIRTRVVSLAAQAMGQMGVELLPPPLRKVKEFTTARRAKLAGAQIFQALVHDPVFREHVATQVRALHPERSIPAGGPAGADDETAPEAAALAFIVRDPGWEQVVDSAVAGVRQESARQPHHPRDQQAELAVAELEQHRSRLREQVTTLKGENAELRRKLGEARAQMRAAVEAAEQAEAAQADLAGRLAQVELAADAESRRLRQRLEQTEADLRTARRREREGREDEVLRARLLLDTVLDAAQGLRRELALPPVQGTPADRVESDLEATLDEQAVRRSPTVEDASLLGNLVRLPRAHLVIDGYNVTKTAWPELTLERQRGMLLAGLAPLAARTGAEITVVFDAADVQQRPPSSGPRGVRVMFSPPGVIADDVIRDLVVAEPAGRVLLVVTGDQEIARDVGRVGGTRVVSASALLGLLAR